MDILDPERRLPGPVTRWLAAMARRAGAALGARGEVRVRIVGDDEMDAAHRRYMGIPGTTDVLTFDYADGPRPDDSGARSLDADIFVCADEAARQASQRGGDTTTELLLYIVHGMLHCLGHDDREPEEAAAMHRREDEVLTAIGVGPVYAREAGEAGRAQRGGGSWA